MMTLTNEIAPLAVWRAPPPPALEEGDVHVWRILLPHLDLPDARQDDERYDELWQLLSSDEQARARRFHFETHRRAFVVSHGMTRRILAGYEGASASGLEFSVGEFGKPSLVGPMNADTLTFNLSHSGTIALLAVSRGREVGVDVERWKPDIEHLQLAGHFFSEAECQALHTLAGEPEDVVAGFFTLWSRKEAYLKASGHGISLGLDHFDVSFAPDDAARILADRKDASASIRWMMKALSPAANYSAALVVAEPVSSILLFDANGGAAGRDAIVEMP